MSSKRLVILASHGSMDAAYLSLILATTAVAMDMEAAIFFTFFGLEIIKKGKIDNLKVAPVANPAMPQPIPGISVPNILGVLPGMTAVATSMMNSWMKKAKVAKLSELLQTAIEGGVRLIGCQMTMGVMGLEKEDLIDEAEIGGAATYLELASDDAINLSF
jgi:peroxiredoxin family protein